MYCHLVFFFSCFIDHFCHTPWSIMDKHGEKTLRVGARTFRDKRLGMRLEILGKQDTYQQNLNAN